MAKSNAYTVRLSKPGQAIIEESAARNDTNRAEILRRAFWHYVSTDPGEIIDGAVEDGRYQRARKIDKSTSSLVQPTAYGSGALPMGADESDRGSRSDQPSISETDGLLEGVYDPLNESVQ